MRRKILLRSAKLALVGVLALVAMAPGVAQVGAADPAVAGKHLFRDYFNSASDPNWTFLNRESEIKKGALWMDGPYKPNPIGRGGYAVTHVGDPSWTDYSFSFSYDSSNLGGCCGVNYTTAYVRVAAVQGKYPATSYGIAVAEPGSPGDLGDGSCSVGGVLPRGLVQIGKVVDGTQVDHRTECASNSATGTNLMRIVADGPTITVFINGRKMISYTDSDPIAFGGLAFGQTWETNGWYDNVDVRALRY
jgi:hypothetical protein